MLTTRHQRPDHARSLVGEGDRSGLRRASWRHPSDFSANVNVNYRGAQFQDVRDQSAGRNVPSRTLVGAKVGYGNDNFGAYLVATNIFDDKYYDYQYENAGRLQALFGEPRMIGLTFEGRF